MNFEKDKTKFNINQLPVELYNYFVLRWVAAAIALIIVVTICLLAELHKALLMISLGILLYIGYVTYNCIRALSGKLMMIEGTCESRTTDHFKVSNPIFRKTNFMNIFEYYGKSSVVITSDDIKFTIPVGHNFFVKEGQTVRIYTFSEGIYPSADNAFLINNPILAKVVKI